MRLISILVSVVGLLLTVVPAFLVLYGRMSWYAHAQAMFVGMILWFVFAPFWMKTRGIEEPAP